MNKDMEHRVSRGDLVVCTERSHDTLANGPNSMDVSSHEKQVFACCAPERHCWGGGHDALRALENEVRPHSQSRVWKGRCLGEISREQVNRWMLSKGRYSAMGSWGQGGGKKRQDEGECRERETAMAKDMSRSSAMLAGSRTAQLIGAPKEIQSDS